MDPVKIAVDEKEAAVLALLEEVEAHLKHCPCIPFVKQEAWSKAVRREIINRRCRELLPPVKEEPPRFDINAAESLPKT